MALQPAGWWATAAPGDVMPLEMPGLSTFGREVGSAFRLGHADHLPVTFYLEAAEKLRHATGGQAERQFSLLFRSDADYSLEQNTYVLEHARLGQLHLFIVPVRLAQGGVQYYEAIFNQAPQEGAVV